ncbi:unnamed protein product [Rotaria socialis]|uniref:Uncharacterized protein n=2 Tax=Rotaria socialis TaxID=392032 RepID=A0A818LN58_9BILA|nr:unnamed protein product [Rotaria socialis]
MFIKYSNERSIISRRISNRSFMISFCLGCIIVALSFLFIYIFLSTLNLSRPVLLRPQTVTPVIETTKKVVESVHIDSLLADRVDAKSKQYVFATCSISSREAYCFYTPIVTLAWRRLGFEVIVIFVGDFINLKNHKKSEDIELIIDHIHLFGGITYDFQASGGYDTRVAQLIRIFLAFLPMNFTNDDDYFTITDSDLIPLRREQYMLTKDYPDGFIVNRFCCGFFTQRNRSYQMIPMSHLYMKKRLWRKMVLQSFIHEELINITEHFHSGLNGSYEYQFMRSYSKRDLKSLLLNEHKTIDFATLSLYARHEFQEVYEMPTIRAKAGWDMDQVLITMLLYDYLNKTTEGQQVKIHERKMLERLDRERPFLAWPTKLDFSQYGDAHITHNIFQMKFWPTHLRLFKYLFNETIVQILNEYYRKYLLLRFV